MVIIIFEPLLLQLEVPEIQLVIAMAHQNAIVVEADLVGVGCAVGDFGGVDAPRALVWNSYRSEYVLLVCQQRYVLRSSPTMRRS